MKNAILFVAILCCVQLSAQRKPKIKGNKTVVEIQKELSPFNAIELKDDLEITLQKSSQEGYTVNADDNLIDVLKFKVDDSTLVISSFYKVTGKKKLEITIFYTELTKITMQDGSIGMDDVITADELYVKTMGPSRIELNASADYIKIDMEGMSSGDFNLSGDSLNIELKNKIDARIYYIGAGSSIKMHDNSSAKLEGTVDVLTVDLYGNANLKAEKLEAISVNAGLQGSTSARINASKGLELSSQGASKTYFYGNGKITLLDFLDTSQLHKEK